MNVNILWFLMRGWHTYKFLTFGYKSDWTKLTVGEYYSCIDHRLYFTSVVWNLGSTKCFHPRHTFSLISDSVHYRINIRDYDRTSRDVDMRKQYTSSAPGVAGTTSAQSAQVVSATGSTRCVPLPHTDIKGVSVFIIWCYYAKNYLLNKSLNMIKSYTNVWNDEGVSHREFRP